MPKLEDPPKIERSPIPLGKHRVVLVAIKEHEGQPYADAKPVMNPETGEMEKPKNRQWIWQFESTKVDPKTNKPYEYGVFTPRYYSATNSANRLTRLMRQLAPEATDEERKGMIAMDALIGRSWDVMLVTATSKNGKEFTDYNYFIPLVDFNPDEIPA